MVMFGYKCTLQTDTEVITYILDYLLRRQGLTLEEAASVIAAPFWSTIASKIDSADQKKHIYLRTMFPSLLITGPFSIVFGFNGGLMALNDRLKLRSMVVGEKEDMVYIASERTVMKINTEMPGAYVFSSGKNMGTFKAVGYPEDIGVFYKLDEYQGYSWTAHGRYPPNTPGWWGGAHPLTLLDSSVVHNGEISSYDANRRFMEMFGYKCTLQTDTEVITYILDYLLRRQSLTLGEASSVIAAPFWSTIASKADLEDQKKHTYLRTMFPSLLITGPFSIVFGFNGGLMALNDRLKLRSMVVGEKEDMVYIASEETAIRAMEPDAENIWAPAGGEPVIITVKDGVLV